MKDDVANNYYMKIKPRMMNEFNLMFNTTQELLIPYFDKKKIVELKEECKGQYIGLFSELPYLGGNKSNSTINLIMGAIVMSIIIPLEKEGLNKQQIGEIIFFTFDGYFKSKPKFIRYLIGKIASTQFFINNIKKDIYRSSLRKYKEDFVLEYIESKEQKFDFGYNYTECALQKLYTKKGKLQ
ncbi:MAG: hypothetical protein PVH88_16680 [Ignavibacteria bacterium]|jgi:hypothetical protein